MEKITTVGVDLAKSIFQSHAVDAAGRVIIQKALTLRDLITFVSGGRIPGQCGGVKAGHGRCWERGLQKASDRGLSAKRRRFWDQVSLTSAVSGSTAAVAWFCSALHSRIRCRVRLVLAGSRARRAPLKRAAANGITEAVLGTGEGHYKKYHASHYTAVDDGVVVPGGLAGGARGLAAGLLHAVEQGRFGPASKLAGRTRRRLDVILAVETRMGDQVRGVTRALTEDPAVARTSTALKAAVQAGAI